MDHQAKQAIKKSRNVLIQANDPRFNYGFHTQEDIESFQKQPEIIDMSQYDYCIKRTDGNDKELPELVSVTELVSFQNLEDMEEFYRQKHPNLPDEYFGIMARYSTGNPITKKEVKNSIKKTKKNPNKPLPTGLQVASGKFELAFD
jgi:hypothetical protein|tara:strand:+ start:1498 stop:1935 length:438 start_codon:yes stop_codon:yes gene_type:complete